MRGSLAHLASDLELDVVRIALRTAQQPVGELVADDKFPGAIPLQFTSEDVGEVSQDAERGSAVGELNIHCLLYTSPSPRD